MINGRPGAEYDGILGDTPVFSPDGKAVEYGAHRGAKWMVVVDSESGAEYDALNQKAPWFQS